MNERKSSVGFPTEKMKDQKKLTTALGHFELLLLASLARILQPFLK